MAELTEPEAGPGCSAVKGPHSLGARIRELKMLDPGRLGALAAEADRLQQRAEDAEARAGDLEWVPAPAWWVVQAPDGSTRDETDDEGEARGAMRPGDTLLRLYVARVRVPNQYRVVDVAPPERTTDGDGRTFAHG